MPGTSTPPPADGATGAPAGTLSPAPGTTPPPETRTFTQAELDAIIADRLARHTAKFADYDELKAKAAKVIEAEENAKTELQKALDRATKAEADGKTAVEKANAALRRAAIVSEATKQNAWDGDVVAALLAGSSAVTVDKEGSVVGAAEAVKTLLKEKPLLLRVAVKPPTSGAEFGGSDPATIDERIRTLELTGKWAEARDLKIAKGLAGVK